MVYIKMEIDKKTYYGQNIELAYSIVDSRPGMAGELRDKWALAVFDKIARPWIYAVKEIKI